MKKILVIGSINIDIVISADHFALPGQTILGRGLKKVPGGKGFNQAIACGKLGADVSMVGCVGNDADGKACLNYLDENSIDGKDIEIVDTNTGTAIITVCNGENTIVLDRGANDYCTSELIEKNVKSILEADIIVLQYEIPMETIKYILEIANREDKFVVLNPAPYMYLEEEYLKYIDLIVLNETEAEGLTGKDFSDIENAKTNIFDILKFGIESVIITLGKNGCVYNLAGEIIHKEAYKVRVVDTTSAGDSFIGGLCTTLSDGKSFSEAIDYATKVSAITVTREGSSISIPTKDEVESLEL